MKQQKIRKAANAVSLTSLVLIAIAATSPFVSAGTTVPASDAQLPKTTVAIPDEHADMKQSSEIDGGATEERTSTAEDMVRCTVSASGAIENEAAVKVYSRPIVKSGTAKVKQVAKKKKAAEEKKKAEEKNSSDQSQDSASSSSSSSSSGDVSSPSNYTYNGSKLTKSKGVNYGPSGRETYYNLNMSGVVAAMRRYGYTAADYAVRSDGVKTLGGYVMVAANYSVHPKGSLVRTSLGMGIVCDTGGFASANPHQLDIATNW